MSPMRSSSPSNAVPDAVLDLLNIKVEGKQITTVATEVHRTPVIDLMDVLKQSLAKRAGSQGDAPVRKAAAVSQPQAGATSTISKMPPVKVPSRATGQEMEKNQAQAGRIVGPPQERGRWWVECGD